MTLHTKPSQLRVATFCLSAASFSGGQLLRAEDKPEVARISRLHSGDDSGLANFSSAYVEGDVFKEIRLAQRDVDLRTISQVSSEQEGMIAKGQPAQSGLIPMLFGLGSLALCSIGFAVYGSRSVPKESRSEHLISRVGEFFDKEAGFYPANKASVRMWMVNNGAIALTGITIALESSQLSFASMYPAVVCLLSAGIRHLAKKYPTSDTSNIYIKTCELLSYVAIGMYATSYLVSALTNTTSLVGVPVLAACAITALTGRALTWVPFLKDMINEARSPNPEKGFPSIKSVAYWTGGTMLASLSVYIANDTAYTSVAIIPLGYMLTNFVAFGIAAGCYLRWKKTIDSNKTIVDSASLDQPKNQSSN
jgi:hypothetical protein